MAGRRDRERKTDRQKPRDRQDGRRLDPFQIAAQQELECTDTEKRARAKSMHSKSASCARTVLSKEAPSRRISRSSTILSTFTIRVSPCLAPVSLSEYTIPGTFPSVHAIRGRGGGGAHGSNFLHRRPPVDHEVFGPRAMYMYMFEKLQMGKKMWVFWMLGGGFWGSVEGTANGNHG